MLMHNSFRISAGVSTTLATASWYEFQRVGEGTSSFLFNFLVTLSEASVDLLVLFQWAMHFPNELRYALLEREHDKCLSTSVLATKFINVGVEVAHIRSGSNHPLHLGKVLLCFYKVWSIISHCCTDLTLQTKPSVDFFNFRSQYIISMMPNNANASNSCFVPLQRYNGPSFQDNYCGEPSTHLLW